MNDGGSPTAGGVELRHVTANAERVDLAEGDPKPPELRMLYDYAIAAAERNINWFPCRVSAGSLNVLDARLSLG
jgi:hypothetical protein